MWQGQDKQDSTYSGGVQRASITPDGTGLFRPVHAGDTVVVPRDEAHDVVADDLVFVAVDVVDARHVQADAGEQRLPARDRVGADDGVVRCELVAGVQGEPRGETSS